MFLLSVVLFITAYVFGYVVDQFIIPLPDSKDSIFATLLKIIFSVNIVVMCMFLISYIPENLKAELDANDRTVNASKMVISFAFFANQDKIKQHMNRLHTSIHIKSKNQRPAQKPAVQD